MRNPPLSRLPGMQVGQDTPPSANERHEAFGGAFLFQKVKTVLI